MRESYNGSKLKEGSAMRLFYTGIMVLVSVQASAAFCGFCGDFCQYSFPSPDAIYETFKDQVNEEGTLKEAQFGSVTFRYRDDDLHDIVSGSKNYKDHKKVTTDLKGKMAQFKLMTSYPFPQYCAEVEDKSIFLVFDQFEYLTDKYQWKNCLQEVWIMS